MFEDGEKQKEFIGAIKEKGRAFIEKRLADTENPIKCVPKQEQPPRISKPKTTREPTEDSKSAQELKKEPSLKKPETLMIAKSEEKPNPFVGKVFVDLPKRKPTQIRSGTYSKTK